jgi:hypothetical protein
MLLLALAENTYCWHHLCAATSVIVSILLLGYSAMHQVSCRPQQQLTAVAASATRLIKLDQQ